MVEKGAQRDALAKHVACHEVDREGLRALRGLSEGRLDLADQSLVVGEGEVEVEREVVRDATLASGHLQHLVEVGELEARSDRELFRGCLHDLSCGGVEVQRTRVAVFGVEGKLVVEGDVQADERRELLGDCHRGDIERR